MLFFICSISIRSVTASSNALINGELQVRHVASGRFPRGPFLPSMLNGMPPGLGEAFCTTLSSYFPPTGAEGANKLEPRATLAAAVLKPAAGASACIQ